MGREVQRRGGGGSSRVLLKQEGCRGHRRLEICKDGRRTTRISKRDMKAGSKQASL